MADWIDEFQREWPVITQAPLSFGIAFVVMTGIIWFGFYKYFRHSMEMKDDLIGNLERKLEHGLKAGSIIQSSTVNIPTEIEFFTTIDDLRTRHPLPETFTPGNEIHAYFLSGEGVFAEHNDYIKYVRRLILPNQDAANLVTLQTLSSVSYADFRSQITKTLAIATMNNVQVRLFQDFIGASLLFCNPDRRDGWVQIGLIIPGQESRDRPHIRLYKATHEAAVLSLYSAFNILWDASSIPESISKSEFISMKDAARKFYEAAKVGKISMALGSEQLSGLSGDSPTSGSAEDILHWWAGRISKEVPVYGRRPPSSVLADIPARDLKHFVFADECTRLKDPMNDLVYYTDLCVNSIS